ncbi:hypothetical protein CCR84_02870 [Rhodocyclus purpureus]|nr:hypothetical protein [Rhodocyclus purpureus]
MLNELCVTLWVKLGSVDGKVTTATAATDLIIGATMDVSPAIGERVDVVVVGIAYVEAGAAIVRGNLVTADSSGRAVTAAPAAGVNNRVAGIAVESATASGDVIPVLLKQGQVKG